PELKAMFTFMPMPEYPYRLRFVQHMDKRRGCCRRATCQRYREKISSRPTADEGSIKNHRSNCLTSPICKAFRRLAQFCTKIWLTVEATVKESRVRGVVTLAKA